MADCFITRRGGGELHCVANKKFFSVQDVSAGTYGYEFDFSSYCTKAEIKMIVVTIILTDSIHSIGCYTNEGIEITSDTMVNAPITSVTVSDESITVFSSKGGNGDYATAAIIY